MDRPIDPVFQTRRKVQRLAQATVVIVGIAGILIWMPGWIAPSVSRREIRTAVVEIGPFEASITASGTVVPEFEYVLSSPIRSKVLKILKKEGSRVEKGQPILELDFTETQLELEKLNKELALKENQRTQLKLERDRNLNDLQSQQQVKTLDLKFLETKYDKTLKMYEHGLIAEDLVRQTQLEVDKARVEVQRLERSARNAEQYVQTQLEGILLEMNILKTQHVEIQRQLELATTCADRNGVLTWVVPDKGATVGQGEVIARIADLSSFRVDAQISEINADRLFVGLPAKILIGDTTVRGAISSILPTIQNGILTFHVDLEDDSHPLLRSNLRVDVMLIVNAKEQTLKIRRGPFINGVAGVHDVFVIRDNTAIRQPVHFGLSSFECYEILEGLKVGDEVIIDDMNDYIHMEKIRVR